MAPSSLPPLAAAPPAEFDGFAIAPIPMWVYDLTTLRFLAVNDAAVRDYGYSRERFLAMTLADVRPADEMPRLLEAVAEHLRRHDHANRNEGVWRHRYVDGRIVHVRISTTAIDWAGRPARLVAVINVDELHAAADERTEARNLLAAVAEAIPDALYVKDADGRYVSCNAAAARNLGREIDDVVGHTDADFFDSALAERIRAGDKRIAGTASSENGELTIAGPQGPLHLATAKSPLVNATGAVVGILGIARDVTAQKRAAASMERQLVGLRLLAEGAAGLLSTDDPAANLTAMLDAVAAHLGCDCYVNYRCDGETMRLVASGGLSDEQRALMAEIDYTFGYCGSCVSTRKPVHATNLAQSTDPRSGPARALGLTAYVGRPLIVGATTLGTLGFGTRRRGSFDEWEIEFVGVVADLVVAARERARLTAERNAIDGRFRAFMDHSPAAAWITDEGGRFEYLSGAYHRTFHAPNAAVGRHVRDVFPPEIADAYVAKTRMVAELGRAVESIKPGIRADGTPGEFLVYKFPLPDHAGIGGIAMDITDQRRAKADLLLRDRAIRAVAQGVLIVDAAQENRPIVYASPGFERTTGYSANEALGREISLLRGAETDIAASARLDAAVRDGASFAGETLCYRRDGAPFWGDVSAAPIFDSNGVLTHSVVIVADATRRRKLEENIAAVQKIEAVGLLAGGIAHDFNNLLTIVNGYADLALDRLPEKDPARDALLQIRRAGGRSAELTAQLLAVGRKRPIAPRVIDLNAIVTETATMLRSAMGPNIDYALDLAVDLAAIYADGGQIEQALCNLAFNARDALPEGGRIEVRTANRSAAELAESGVEAPPHGLRQAYVELAVIDNGVGMCDATKARVFEPFFTTKGLGHGTGLGLAVVQGTVAQAGGFIAVESIVGIGTTFRILLPVCDRPARRPTPRPERPSAAGLPREGIESILLVEDEDAVREYARVVLTSRGYRVTAASNAERALALAADHALPFDLLVTDVAMPALTGIELARRVRAIRSNLPALFVSAHGDRSTTAGEETDGPIDLLPKPFAAAELAARVRAALDRSRRRRPRPLVT